MHEEIIIMALKKYSYIVHVICNYACSFHDIRYYLFSAFFFLHVSNYYTYQINTCIWIKFQEAVGDTLEELWISYNNIEKLKGINVLKRLKVCNILLHLEKIVH